MDLGRRGDFWRDRTGLVIVLTTLNVAVVSVVIVCLVWCGVVGVTCGRLVCGVTAGDPLVRIGDERMFDVLSFGGVAGPRFINKPGKYGRTWRRTRA